MNELTKKLSAIVSSQLPDGYTSVSYAIMRHGELIAADALGHCGGNDKKPADLRSTYNVASISKVVCTIAVMQLVERGLVELDAPVARYLPRLSMPDERFRCITLRHCLSHTSGLPGTQWLGFSVSDVSDEHYYEDVYDYLSKNILKAEPGAYAVYCNDGFTLAEMVVSEVTGVPYAEYCLRNITEPLGAQSARLSGMHADGYTLVREGARPPELMLIRGGAGFTMAMPDLCKVGQVFLAPSDILSEPSKREMALPQGKTFLQYDTRTADFGLGWDNVRFRDTDYTLGEGALLKMGNSFQFTTFFCVLPAYDAVLAISETHDCRLDVGKLMLRLFATAMLEEGVNPYAAALPAPQEVLDHAGLYLTQNCVLRLRIAGATADIMRVRPSGGEICFHGDLRWDGGAFVSETGQRFFFEEHDGNRYLLTTLRGPSLPFAMQVRPTAVPPAAWTARIGKRYVVWGVRAHDIVVRDIMSGFTLHAQKDCEGLFVLSFACRSDSGVYSCFDGAVHAASDDTGASFTDTPSNPGRDALNPRFFTQDGAEYCDVASYRYRDAQSLPVYTPDAGFPQRGETAVYRFEGALDALPSMPEGRRIMVLDGDMVAQYDSLFDANYTPVTNGFILLI